MGNVDGVPLASQVKSVVQATKGDVAGAWDTQNKFSERCIGAAQVRSMIEALSGDVEAAAATQTRFLENARNLMDAHEDDSNLVDALPGVSQLKSVSYAANGQLEQATATQRNFTQHCPVVAQTRSLLEFASGRPEEALETQKSFFRFTSRALDKVPVLGHAKGMFHVAIGENERGERAFREASRVTAKTVGLLGTAFVDMLSPDASHSGARGPQGVEATEPGVCEAAEPLSHSEIVEHTLCFHITSEQVRSHGACPICMQDFQEKELVTTLRCFHLFHTDCAGQWLSRSGNCPVCRVRVRPATRS